MILMTIALIKIIISTSPYLSYHSKDNGSLNYGDNCKKNILKVAKLDELGQEREGSEF